MPVALTVGERIVVVERLRAAGCVFAEDEADLLLRAADDARGLATMVAQRAAGLPLEQVVGWALFCGLRITVVPGVFVPRYRTEFLVHQALAVTSPGNVVIDLCCGTGAVAAALVSCVPDLAVSAVDVDPAAVHCARRNLPMAHVYQGDLFAPLPPQLRGRVDVVTANAPYVPTGALAFLPADAREHEPTVALDGGVDGLDVHRRVAAAARDWLAPGGHLFIETTADQASTMVGIFATHGLAPSSVSSNEFDATVVIARRP